MTNQADYPRHAELMDVARKVINRNFADPGKQDAHDARSAAALVIHYGGTLDEALAAALPSLRAAA